MDTELAMRACLVDPDLRQSNWQLSRCGSMKERNHFPMIDSNSLAMVGRSDIGLRSLQMDVDVGIDDTALVGPITAEQAALVWAYAIQRFSNWGPRTKGGPRRVPMGSARGFRKVVIVCTVFNNLRPICFQICTRKSVNQYQCIAWKCCRGLARQAFC